MTTVNKLLTAEEFAALPDDGRRLELINGEVVEMTPGNVEHGSVTASLTSHLFVHVMENGLGRVVTADPGIFVQRAPDIVRAPDVCFYSQEREPSPQSRRQGWTDAIPDLVAEVVSPGDMATEFEEKVQMWLAAGVRLVLVL
ncbi:MAG: Uma2 family endonuclease, partial [Chloroflexi bacterium]|nr:Uma2 family endonuclease [Chloroflexota bacterium]